MKKSLLFFLVTLFSIFMLAGCSDDSSDGKKENLTGTYKVTFFGTQVTNPKPVDENNNMNSMVLGMADLMYVSNDCKKAVELYGDIINTADHKNQCPVDQEDAPAGTAELLDGAVVISFNADNELRMTSRVQLGGQIMDSLAAADKYQFTEYYPTSEYTDINASGKGVKGWNYDSDNNAPSQTSSEFPESPYKVTKLDDGSYRLDMTLVGKKVNVMGMVDITVDAVTTVLMEKLNSETTPLENKIQKEFPKTDDTE